MFDAGAERGTDAVQREAHRVGGEAQGVGDLAGLEVLDVAALEQGLALGRQLLEAQCQGITLVVGLFGQAMDFDARAMTITTRSTEWWGNASRSVDLPPPEQPVINTLGNILLMRSDFLNASVLVRPQPRGYP